MLHHSGTTEIAYKYGISNLSFWQRYSEWCIQAGFLSELLYVSEGSCLARNKPKNRFAQKKPNKSAIYDTREIQSTNLVHFQPVWPDLLILFQVVQQFCWFRQVASVAFLTIAWRLLDSRWIDRCSYVHSLPQCLQPFLLLDQGLWGTQTPWSNCLDNLHLVFFILINCAILGFTSAQLYRSMIKIKCNYHTSGCDVTGIA